MPQSSFIVAVGYTVAALSTVAYSVPPLRLKRHPIGSNLIIALVRGGLLKPAERRLHPFQFGLRSGSFILRGEQFSQEHFRLLGRSAPLS